MHHKLDLIYFSLFSIGLAMAYVLLLYNQILNKGGYHEKNHGDV
jgi:hypothetical protein